MQQADSKKRLDPLPENDSEYWKDAETHKASWQTKDEARKEVKATLKDHYFVRVSGHQAQCTHCNWGFQLDSGDRIKDGHLYNKEKKLII